MTDDVQRRERERAVASRNAWGDLAANMRSGEIPMSCTRPREADHRASDWRLPADPEQRLAAGAWVCGICHAPAGGLQVELRVDVEQLDDA